MRSIDGNSNGTDGGKSINKGSLITGSKNLVTSNGSSDVGSLETASAVLDFG